MFHLVAATISKWESFIAASDGIEEVRQIDDIALPLNLAVATDHPG